MRNEILQMEYLFIGITRLEYMLLLPNITFQELDAIARCVSRDLWEYTDTLASLRIIRHSCFFWSETKTKTTLIFPDKRSEEIVEIEYHPPNSQLLLRVLKQFYPFENFNLKSEIVSDWVASGAIAPPQSLIDDFDMIEARTFAGLGKKDRLEF